MEPGYTIKKYTQDIHPESHIHDFFEIFISLTNEGKFFVNEEAYPLTFGKFFFLNPFEIHHCFCLNNQEHDRYVIHFTREYLERLSTARTNLLQTFRKAPLTHQMSDEKLADLLGQLSRLMTGPGRSFGADVEHGIEFARFLLSALRAVQGSEDYRTGTAERDDRVDDILDYIHRHYTEKITLDDLVAQFYVSKSRISQVFKNATGFSIGNYIIIYRIKRACELLQSGVSVQEAGRRVGFNNNTHFVRMFKQHIGCPPGRFARNSLSSRSA